MVNSSVAFLTVMTMCAFAANSFFCRAALGAGQIDPASFTAVRLISGAFTLMLCLWLSGGLSRIRSGNWAMAMGLLGYAVFFSLAYIQLSTGTGALVLFGFVQMSMIAWAAFHGDRLKGIRAIGALVAVVGLVVLLWPSLGVPESLLAVLWMALAGMCWGAYSVLGKGSNTPLADTAGNFWRAGLVMSGLWLAVVLMAQAGIHLPGITQATGNVLYTVDLPMPTLSGLGFALASGCLASGLGYALWYKVLPQLPTTSAASVQLSVPVIAALAGWAVLAEPISWRLLVAMVLTLGGIAVVLRAPKSA